MLSAISFSTDLGHLVAFDPDLLQHRVRVPRGWWREGGLTELAELREGAVAILPIGKEGSYRIALFQGETLPEAEAALATGKLSGLRLLVRSGEVFLGAAERLPGGGHGDRMAQIPDTGAPVSVAPGAYALEVWALNWRGDDEYFDDNGEVRPEAPADFVLLLREARDPLEELPPTLPPLRDLLPKKEAKGRAKVGHVPQRRRSVTPAPSARRGRRRGPQPTRAPSVPRAPRVVPAQPGPYSQEQVRAAFREVLYGHALHPPLGAGPRALVMRPFNLNLQPTELDWEALLKKLTKVRNELRVLEGKLNSEKALSLDEKIALQQPITAVYQAVDGLQSLLCEPSQG